MYFDRAVQLILDLEAGYSNDPNDPGGETNFGISKRAFPHVDIKNLTREKAIDLYRRYYWDYVRGDELPWPLALHVFDMAVNQGVQPAITTLQRAAGVQPDGQLGPVSMARVRAIPTLELAPMFSAFRALRYMTTKNFDRYGAGWLKRLFRVSMEGGL